MSFKDVYTSATEKESGKKVISDDAYAIGEAINDLIAKIEHARLTL